MYNTTSAMPTTGDGTHKDFVARVRSSKGPALGVGLTLNSVPVAQAAGISGADFVFIDMEHSVLSPEAATNLVHAVVASSRGDCSPLVRVPSHGAEWIKWALDSGAAGIIVPMVNNAAEAAQIIDKAVFPPVGRRSFGPFLAPYADPDGPQVGVAGYMARAMRGGIAIFPMIESVDGLNNVEEIVSTQGVTGVFIGPFDLRLALGLPGGIDGEEPEFIKALQKITLAVHERGKVIGTVAIGEEAIRKRAAEAVDFVVSTSDYNILLNGLQHNITLARQASVQDLKSSSHN